MFKEIEDASADLRWDFRRTTGGATGLKETNLQKSSLSHSYLLLLADFVRRPFVVAVAFVVDVSVDFLRARLTSARRSLMISCRSRFNFII
jgi:hypothetical protein